MERLTDTENQSPGGHGKGSEGLEVLNIGRAEKGSGWCLKQILPTGQVCQWQPVKGTVVCTN